MEVWVIFVGGFLDIAGGEYAEWTWDFYGIYSSEEKANEVIASLKAELDEDDNETDYKMEKHFVQ